MSALTPVAVEVWRGVRVESRHRVALAVVDTAGRALLEIGDALQAVYPRSAVKPLQALPLVESGAADAMGLSEKELALACASHGGEPVHVEAVGAWLQRLGLDDRALACGPHPPTFQAAAARLIREGRAPRRIHNNCSGKHTAMLALARHLGAPLEGYELPDHPVQQGILKVIAELTDGEVLPQPGVDGCSIPSFALPLRALALAYARFATPGALPPARAAAAQRIAQAMHRHPTMVAGSGRCCTAVLRALPRVLVKTGAEGVFIAAIPARGIGIALKAEDGATRAAEVALLAALQALGEVPEEARAALAGFARPPLANYAGTLVGKVAPAAGWPGPVAA